MTSRDVSPDAQEAFDEYLRLVEEGHSVDFETFAAERPDVADALAELKRRWDRLGGLVEDLGSGLDDRAIDALGPGGGAAAPEAGPGDRAARAAPDPDASGSSPGEAAWGAPGATPGPAPTETQAVELEVSSSPQPASVAGPGSIPDIVGRLTGGDPDSRYESGGEIARGGMGRIVRVRDARLRRLLAMKVMLEEPDEARRRDRTGFERRLGRFLEEAQITGQLDHPGIVPVHDIGLDASGRLYFTMRLVRGRSFRAILGDVHAGRDGWTVPRALSVLLRVCEAMAYAHSKRVVHRDLKPANIMVGRFGETYVMDWGLAKVLDHEDRHDLRPASSRGDARPGSDAAASLSEIRTARRDTGGDPSSPYVTVDGTVIGTPAYMSPEQAQGRIDEIDGRTDVYAVGAMLYHLLSGHMPYAGDGETPSGRALIEAIRDGPPRPVTEGARRAPAELVAICEKAMARDLGERYGSMLAMAEDLAAFVEGRVVKAYEAGALAELRKWVVRNKGTAAVLAAALAVLGALFVRQVRITGDLADSRDTERRALAEARDAQRELRVSNEELAAMNVDLEASKSALEERADELLAARDAQREALREARQAQRELERAHADLEMFATELESRNTDLVRARDAEREARAAAEAARAALEASFATLAERNDELAALVEAETRARARVEIQADELRRRSDIAALDAADAALRFFDLDEARRQLASIPAGRRGWEWQHLWTRTDPSLAVLQGHDGRVADAAFARRGDRVVTAGWDGTARIWTSDDGLPEHVLDHQGAAVIGVAVHPDGLTVATGDDAGHVALWDAAGGRRLSRRRLDPEQEFGPAVYALAFAGGGDRLLAGTDDGRLLALASDGTPPVAFPTLHTRAITSLDVDAEGVFAVSGSEDWKASLWDAVTGDHLLFLFEHDGPVRAVALAPGAPLVATGSDDGLVRLFDTGSGALRHEMAGHAGPVLAVAFAPGGRRLVSAGADGTVRSWSPWTGTARDVLLGHRGGVSSVAFDGDGSRLVTSSEDGTARLWDATWRGDGTVRLEGHGDAVASLDVGPGGLRAVSAAWDGQVRLWQLDELLSLDVRDLDARGTAAVAFSPDGNRVAAGVAAIERGAAHPIHVWDASRPDRLGLAVSRLAGHDDRIEDVAFAPDGRLLASASRDHTARLWDSGTGVLRHELSHDGWVAAVAFDPARPRLATAAWDDRLRLWHIDSGALLGEREPGGPLAAVAFDRSGSVLATGGGSGVVHLLEPETFATRHALHGHGEAIVALAFHPGGDRLASASVDGTIRLWDPETGDARLTLRHGETSVALAFGPDGRLLASLGAEIAVHESRPPAAGFLARRRRLAVASLAATAFEERLARHLDPNLVEAELERDDALDPQVRREAVRLARNFGDNPDRLAESAWTVLLDPDAGATAHRAALRKARAADALRPGDARLRSVLGLARLRTGEPLLAIARLREARQLETPGDRPRSWDLFVLALAHARLGDATLARVHLEEALLEAASEDPASETRWTTTTLEMEAREAVARLEE